MIVLIPAFEPDRRLLDLVAALDAATTDSHVVIVDDGSGPQFGHVFDAAQRMGSTVLGYPVNCGKGYALKFGLRFIEEHYPGADVVCADSDGQHSPQDIAVVAARVRAGEPMVLGVRRFTGAVPTRSLLGNSLTRGLFRLATRQRIQDTQTGLRGYRGPLVPWLQQVPGERFEYELRILLRAARDRVPIGEAEIATIYLDGNASSHFRPVVDSVRIYAPLVAFLLSSFTAFLIDVALVVTLFAATGSLLASVVGARVVSASANFIINRRVVFAARRSYRVSGPAFRYATLATTLLALNLAVLSTLTRLGVPLLPAKVVTEVLLVALSYQLQSRVVFARPRHHGLAPADGEATVVDGDQPLVGSGR